MAFGLSAGAATLLGSVAAPIVGGLLGGQGSSQSGTQTQSQTQQIDPRIASIIFGSGQKTLKPGAVPTGVDEYGQPTYSASDYTTDNSGLLSRYQALLDKPQSTGLNYYGTAADHYLGTNGGQDLNTARNSALQMLNGNMYNPVSMKSAQGTYTMPMNAASVSSPLGYQASTAGFSQAGPASGISAPAQNGLGVTNALNDVIYGDLGNNPYLAGAIQKGLNQSTSAFQNLQSDATKNFKESVLPALRGDAIVNGQYGGSRQGIAEGKAADSFAMQMNRALSQVGQNMTDSAVSAQANQFGQDRQNQLSAAMGLSGQQYNVAGQDAAAKNQVNLANSQMANNQMQFNAGQNNSVLGQLYQGNLQTNLANAGYTQQANQNNYAGNQQMSLANLKNNQQANQQNGAWQVANNALDSQTRQSGLSALNGLSNNAYTLANNQNDYSLNQAGKINGLLTPYVGINGTSTSSTPIYQNQVANALGGALMGSKLFDAFGNAIGGTRSSATNTPNTNWGSFDQPYQGPDVSNILNFGG